MSDQGWVEQMVAEQQRRRRERQERYELRDRSPEDRDRWYAAGQGISRAERAEEDFVLELAAAALAGDHDAADNALDYLEANPRYFRSGYIKTRVARRLAQAPLDDTQRARGRPVALGWVDGTHHLSQRGACPLAGATADNELRRELRQRLHHGDERIARRALEALTYVRHPGITVADRERAQAIALAWFGRGRSWIGSRGTRVARWLWTPEWETELRELMLRHDPHRAAAKQLIDICDRRRARQRARRAGP